MDHEMALGRAPTPAPACSDLVGRELCRGEAVVGLQWPGEIPTNEHTVVCGPSQVWPNLPDPVTNEQQEQNEPDFPSGHRLPSAPSPRPSGVLPFF